MARAILKVREAAEAAQTSLADGWRAVATGRLATVELSPKRLGVLLGDHLGLSGLAPDPTSDGRATIARAFYPFTHVRVTDFVGFTGLGMRTVRRLIARGELPTIRSGARRLLDVAELRQWLAARRRGTRWETAAREVSA